MQASAFFYVDGIPTKGCWITIYSFTDWDDIKDELADKGVIKRNAEGDPDYDGDLLVADYEGLAKHFYHAPGILALNDLVEFLEFLESRSFDEDVVEAALVLGSTFSDSVDLLKNAYRGYYETVSDFGEALLKEGGLLERVPAELRMYIDSESYGRDQVTNSYSEHNGHYFYTR